jgi:hypothetical protein
MKQHSAGVGVLANTSGQTLAQCHPKIQCSAFGKCSIVTFAEGGALKFYMAPRYLLPELASSPTTLATRFGSILS